MPDRDEFERLLEETGVAQQVDDFDSLAGELGVLPEDEPAPALPAREPGTGEDWADFLLGGLEGATLGNVHNLGNALNSRWLPVVAPQLGAVRDVVNAVSPGIVRRGTDELADLVDRSQETGAGKLGRGVGTAATALGLSALAGPGVGAQAAIGAGLGGASAAGESDADWRSVLGGMAEGGLFGAAGGALGKAGNAIAGSADEILRTLKAPRIGQMVRHPVQSALTMGARAVAQQPGTMNALASTARGAGALAAAGGGSLTGMIGKAQAQDTPDVAYGTAPTMAWAVQSVLTSGSGLEPADEQRLTEAVLSGDMGKLISTNFALQQRSPAYAARLQRELESLQEE